MTDKVQIFRKEVERLKSNLIRGACASQIAMETRCKEEAYNEVLAILDTLQEEPVSEEWIEELRTKLDSLSKEDFEKVMAKYSKYGGEELVNENLDEATNTYVDNWYKLNNLDKESYPIDVEISKNDFKAGAKWQMAQMIKNATDVIVHIEAGNYPYIPQIELYDYDKDVPLAKEGDTYKVILIKED